jgi:hypothetical protein
VRFASEELEIKSRRAHLAVDESFTPRKGELRRAVEKASQELDSARRAARTEESRASTSRRRSSTSKKSARSAATTTLRAPTASARRAKR